MVLVVKLQNISRVDELQEPIFNENKDSVIVRKTILHKEDDLYNHFAVNRYATFLNKHSCELIHGVEFDIRHFFSFDNINNILYIKHYNDIGEDSDYDYTSDDDDDFPTIIIEKYIIEGREGYYWKLEDNFFFLYNDICEMYDV
jgi:hypothetical protein